MFGIVDFGAFLLAGILLNLTPGSDTIYILSRGISQGRKAGVLSALGISTGSLIHTLFAAFGLSIVLSQSATAFNAVKYLGALYLIYLGIRAIATAHRGEFKLDADTERLSDGRIYLSGILTNVLNPKVALFFLAFLPQFIDPRYANSTLSFIILGLTFVVTGSIWCLVLALASATLSEKIKQNYRVKMWLDRLTGVVFVILGVRLALLRK